MYIEDQRTHQSYLVALREVIINDRR